MDAIALSEVILDAEKSEVTIRELQISDPKLFSILSALDKKERKEFIKRAICIGATVQQVMDITSRVDYVRSEFDKIKSEFCRELDSFLSEDGILPSKLDEYLGEDGELKQALKDHFGEEGSVFYKLLNPNDDTTPLGKFTKQLEDLLNADKEGTAFHRLKKCVEEGFDKVNLQLAEARGRAEEREKSTAKGADFQEYIFEVLDEMAKDFEDAVEFVGDTGGSLGKVGDVVIHINKRATRGIEQRIVLEAKDKSITMKGKNSFLKELDSAKENRNSQYAIGAIDESHAPNSVGVYRRYPGAKIICSIPKESYPFTLEVAYKVARGEIIASVMQMEAELDPNALLDKIAEITGQIEKMRAVKGALTGAKGKIDDARGVLEEMEEAIKCSLRDLTNMIKSGED